jgi:alanyl-tRNA synthetase
VIAAVRLAFRGARHDRRQADVFGHHGVMVRGTLAVGDTVHARVDRHPPAPSRGAEPLRHAPAARRAARGAGQSCAQKGSLVDPERLRFDFSHFEAMTRRDPRVELRSSTARSAPTRRPSAHHMSIRRRGQGRRHGAVRRKVRRLDVRVLDMGEFLDRVVRRNPCQRTGDIGLFKVVAEGGVAAGMRRIEAITGENAVRLGAAGLPAS